MIIYFLRHASAGDPAMSAAKDEKRPLDKLGVEQSHDIGAALAGLKVEVDAIISSPLLRAMQTAEITAQEIGHKDKVQVEVALRPEAGYDQFQELLNRHQRKPAIMLVGHNPSLTEFLNRLLSGEPGVNVVELKKGALAKLESDGSSAILKWCVTPKFVRTLQRASASSSRPKTLSK